MNYLLIGLLVVIFTMILIAYLYKQTYMSKHKKQTWKDVLDSWSKGDYLTYPSMIKNRFFWETTPITNEDSSFQEKFIQSKSLNMLQEDWSRFKQQLSENKTSFYNLSGDALLVVPVPVQTKKRNFTTLKDFMDTASVTQQKRFWKEVAKQIKELTKNGDKKYWVSVHGLGVPYLHVRICTKPKYYITKKFGTM